MLFLLLHAAVTVLQASRDAMNQYDDNDVEKPQRVCEYFVHCRAVSKHLYAISVFFHMLLVCELKVNVCRSESLCQILLHHILFYYKSKLHNNITVCL